MNELHIFVDSERPDQYLNSIVHCVLEREVRTVTFLHIESLTSADDGRTNPGLSARVMAAVQSLLESLAVRQEYLSTTVRFRLADSYNVERACEISTYYRRVRELPVAWSNRAVPYENLRDTLKVIAAKGSVAFLDVSAVKKRYLGDIVAAGLVEGIRGLWTFDLLIPRADFEKPLTMLIHELCVTRPLNYRYANLLDTATYKDCAKLVFVRAPKYRRMAIAVVSLIVVGAIGYVLLGKDSEIVQFVIAISGIASIAALALVFNPPRN
jgi:hypothetical protein